MLKLFVYWKTQFKMLGKLIFHKSDGKFLVNFVEITYLKIILELTFNKKVLCYLSCF